jgi:hypothetical protein
MTTPRIAHAPHPQPTTTHRLRRPVLGATLALVAFAACQGAADHRNAAASDPPAPEPRGDEMLHDKTAMTEARAAAPAGQGAGLLKPVDNRKIVRTGHVALVVTTYDEARAQLDVIVQQAGGFIDSTRVSHHEGRVSQAELVLRIPASAFGGLLPALRALGEIQSETTDASDITDQYVDVSARLASARALEKRLLELAATGTGRVSEVLEVERELARVRAEVEQYQGTIRMWDDQVALSTLSITLSTKQPEIAAPKPPAPPSFGDNVEGAFDRSVEALGDAGEGLAMAAVSLLPWMPLILPGLFLGRRFVRRHLTLPRAIVHVAPPEPPAPPAPDAPAA